MTKVFLGGTCNSSTWRDVLIPMLSIGHFNPVVPDRTPECMAEELRQREQCDILLYTLTPAMVGFTSVAEAVEDSIKRPHKTVLCLLGPWPDKHTQKCAALLAEQVERNTGRKVFTDLGELAEYLNAWVPADAGQVDAFLNFGQAIELLKAGACVARLGWNGKGMYLAYIPGGTTEQPNVNGGKAIEAMPWIGMKTADNKFVPWLASQTDMLAEDWVLSATI